LWLFRDAGFTFFLRALVLFCALAGVVQVPPFGDESRRRWLRLRAELVCPCRLFGPQAEHPSGRCFWFEFVHVTCANLDAVASHDVWVVWCMLVWWLNL
jgi:hypothetical protein